MKLERINFNESKDYELISNFNNPNLDLKNRDGFTNHDINSIEDMCKEGSKISYLHLESDKQIEIGYKGRNNIIVYKCSDEWFMLVDCGFMKYYKCDQILGVIDCIKDRIEEYDEKFNNTKFFRKWDEENMIKEFIDYSLCGDINTLNDITDWHECEYFTTQEVEDIKNLCDKYIKVSLRLMTGGKRVSISANFGNINIYKKSDEWYYLNEKWNKNYKCDQLQGLLKCIEMILGKNKNFVPTIHKLRSRKNYKIIESNEFVEYEAISSEELNRLTGAIVEDDMDDDTEEPTEYGISEWRTDFIRNRWEDFTKKELDIIKEIFPDKIIHNEYECPVSSLDWENTSILETKGVIIISEKELQPIGQFDWDGTILYIIKLQDEWYIVSIWSPEVDGDGFQTGNYKCDQWSGLLQLLNNYSNNEL